MAQRISAGWTLYLFAILAAIAATVHSWSAGSPYFGNEFRTVELRSVSSTVDDEKVTWQGSFIDQATSIEFTHDIKPRAADEFVKEGGKPKVMPMLMEIGFVDPVMKKHHDNFYLYRWVATGSLVVLLFWWVIFQCPEIFLIFAIFD